MISPLRCGLKKVVWVPEFFPGRSSLKMPCPGAHGYRHDRPWPAGCASRGAKRPTDQFSHSLGTTRRVEEWLRFVFPWVQMWQPKK